LEPVATSKDELRALTVIEEVPAEKKRLDDPLMVAPVAVKEKDVVAPDKRKAIPAAEMVLLSTAMTDDERPPHKNPFPAAFTTLPPKKVIIIPE
jgi:hypothetical protein